ncbi:MAG: hypothetical protein WBM74_17765, partial [Polyangiales bacterium]
MTRFIVIAFACCALALASCSNNANNVVLSSLNRSAKMQFLCADLDYTSGNAFDPKGFLPASICTSDAEFATDVNAQLLGAVTQIQTGEVAVINFTRSAIINTNPTIPGVTSLTVGEQPTGIQISPFDSDYTYVTSFSPKTLTAIESLRLISRQEDSEDADGSERDPRQVRFDAGPTDLALHEVATVTTTTVSEDDDRITGATSDVSYRYLYAAIPELEQIAQVQVMIDSNGVQTLGDPVMLRLDTYGCPIEQVTPPDSDKTDYNRICPEGFQDREDPDARVVKTVKTTQPCFEGATPGPSPVSLTVDYGSDHGSRSSTGTGPASDDVLLVADANQPVIHRFALGRDGATPLDPIVTGTPTSEIDVTPLVPASSDPNDTAATQRYLYAVSAADSSILVVDYTEDPEGTADEDKRFGAVLPVLAGVSARANEENVESRDRVRFAFSNVRAIEVVTPFYELEADGSDGKRVPADDLCSSSDSNAFALAQNEANMRGVFLAASLSDGRMVFLDIYDLNAPCRGGAGIIACTLAETGPDRFASIRRHRLRFGQTPSTFISIDGSPSFQFNSAPGRLDETNGDASNSDGPGLKFINCPPSMFDQEAMGNVSSMFGVFGVPSSGSDGDTLICASSQVWSSFSEQWNARWEGLIPQSEGGLGLFADENFDGDQLGNWFQAGDVPFCRVGVLGPQDADADLVESYPGDRLLITGDLPPSTRDEPACEDFVDLKEDIEDRPVWFPILGAFNNELEIGPAPAGADYTLEEVRNCFPQFTEYQIHTQSAYTVTGTASGFINRVIPDENGECILDPSRPVDLPDDPGDPNEVVDVDTYLTGRAFEDKQFINPLVSFRIGPFPADTNVTDTTIALLNFNILNQFTPLILLDNTSLRSLPSSLLFSPYQDQLYLVDFEAGVRRIQFSPLFIADGFE